jgi:hypothetical protein
VIVEPRLRTTLRWAILAGVVIAGGVIRWRAAQGDLWFDEIWSMLLTTRAHSVSGVLTDIHHANNHYLNTAYLMLVGSAARPELYRLPAVLAGSAAIILMAFAAASWPATPRRGPFTTVWLGAGSFLLVQYTSEARGYGLALLFAMLCYMATARWLARPSWGAAAGFAVSAILGVLAHLTVAFVVAGCVGWILVDAWNRRAGQQPAVHWSLLLLVGPPAAFVVWLWASDLRFLDSGGGPAWSPPKVLRETLRYTFSVPAGPMEWLGAVALAGAGWEAICLYRRNDARWMFLAMVFVIPSAICVIVRPEIIGARYFLVCAPFLILVVAQSLARLSDHGIVGRIAWGLALVAFTVGGVFSWGPLLRDGRGHYREAVEYMAAATAEPVLRVASDHDARNGLLLAYFAHGLPSGRRVDYVSHEDWAGRSFDWFIAHRMDDESPPPQMIDLPPGQFSVVQHFGHGGISGWSWFVYRRSLKP